MLCVTALPVPEKIDIKKEALHYRVTGYRVTGSREDRLLKRSSALPRYRFQRR